jgi:acetolactate synthase-1/2/3 large subunit
MLDFPIRTSSCATSRARHADATRATGNGVAIATSGPRRTWTGIATAMMDSSPIVLPARWGAAHRSDAFQETDITGITLPITKHNFS